MKNIYILFFFLSIGLFTSNFFGQNISVADSMYAIRRTQAAAGENYLETEKNIFATTETYPRALVTISQVDANRKFEFMTYKEISADRQDQIEQRLVVSIPGTVSVEIENHSVTAIFNAEASEENILQLFRILGYNQYEVK